MKNTTLIKLFLSLVFVFSSTVAFTEEKTNASELTIFPEPTELPELNELMKDINRIQRKKSLRGYLQERRELKRRFGMSFSIKSYRKSLELRSERSINQALIALESLSQFSGFPAYEQGRFIDSDKIEKILKTLTQAIEYELKRSGYLVGEDGRLEKLEISKTNVGRLSQEEQSRKIISVAMKSLLEVYYYSQYMDLDRWIKDLIKTKRYSFKTLMSVLYEVRFRGEFFNFIDLFYTTNRSTLYYSDRDLHIKLFENISNWPDIMKHPKFSNWVKSQIELKGVLKFKFNFYFIKYFLTQHEVEKKFPEFFDFIDLLVKEKYHRDHRYVVEHILSQDAVQKHEKFADLVEQVIQTSFKDPYIIGNLITHVFARRQVWGLKEFPSWLRVAVAMVDARFEEALMNQLNKLSEHPFFKLLNKENKKLTIKGLRQAINSGQWDRAYKTYYRSRVTSENHTGSYKTIDFIKAIKAIQSPYADRSKEELERVEEAFKSLSGHSSKRVIKVLTEAIEYELKIGHFKYIGEGYNPQRLNWNVINTAVRSLHEVIYNNETENYQELDRWITRFLKEASYDTLVDFSNEVLSRHDMQVLIEFPRWMKMYMEKYEKEVSNSELFQIALSERELVKKGKKLPKKHLRKLSIFNLLAIFNLLDGQNLFTSFFDKKRQHKGNISQFEYNFTLYQALQDAIKSGEYDKAYKDHLNKIKSWAEKGEVPPLSLRKALRMRTLLETGGKEKSKPNACGKLFSI